MKTFILTILTISASARAAVELKDLKMADGTVIQVCTRYPDASRFPGRRPALMIIQGSGRHDTCLRLERPWGDTLIEKGVIIYSRQKRGLRVDPKTQAFETNIEAYAKNTIP